MSNEVFWRLGFFLAGLVIFSFWEALTPRRPREISRWIRWPRNLGLNISSVVFLNLINAFLVRFLVPLTASGAAIWASSTGVGLMNWLDVPNILALIIGVILLDLLIYGQHVLFHWSPWLWRLHMIHHVDQELDATSGIRFHPVEILLSMLIKVAAVIALGVPFWGVVIFEIVLNVSAMFNHGNIRLPRQIDSALRKVIVTPDMHRVHHSVIPQETHSNFGFNLSIWDKIFRTYRAEPEKGQMDMELGLPGFHNVARTGLGWMIAKPFMKSDSDNKS